MKEARKGLERGSLRAGDKGCWQTSRHKPLFQCARYSFKTCFRALLKPLSVALVYVPQKRRNEDLWALICIFNLQEFLAES